MEKISEKVKEIGAITGIGAIALGACAVTSPIWVSFAVYNYFTRNHRTVKNPDKIVLPREVKKTAKSLDKNGMVEVRFSPLRKEEWDFESYREYNVDYVQDGKKVNLANAVVSGENMDEFSFPKEGWHYEIFALFPTAETFFLKVPKRVDIRYDINLERQRLSSFFAKFGINTKLLQSEELAHKSALSIANQIAEYSDVPMRDYSLEDRATLELKFRGLNN